MNDDDKNSPTFNLILKKIEESLKNSTRNSHLTDLKILGDFPQHQRQVLAALYGHNDGMVRRFATMLNSIYTQQINVFITTQDNFAELIKKDSANNSLRSCDNTSYKIMMNHAYIHGWIKELRRAVQRSKGVSGQAGLYELTDSDFLFPLIKEIGKDVCDANKKATLEWFDKASGASANDHKIIGNIPTEMIELFNKSKEKINERKKH